LAVIIPCRDDRHLPATLDSLGAQESSPPFEVIVVDASGEELVDTLEVWRNRLDIRVVRGAWGATPGANRNTGVAASNASLLLFIDADDVVNGSYVRSMAEALQSHPVVCSTVEMNQLNPWNPGGTHPQQTGLIKGEFSFLPFAGAGTMGIRRSLFEEIGGFDALLRRYQEADLCWRIQLSGHAPPALVRTATLHYRLQRDPAKRLWRVAAQGRGQALLYRRFRHAGMPRQTFSDVVDAWVTIVSGLVGRATRRSTESIGYPAAIRIGRLLGSVRYRVVYL
jgi:glycosyltransferase involved in cell wall biosynthesis